MNLKAGMRAPAFILPGSDGKDHALKEFLGKNIVLYFYPKDDTPGCTKEACSFRDSIQEIKKLGAEVIGVSKDSIDSHNKFKKKYKLDFLLLSDSSGKMIESYGAFGEKSIYGKTFLGIIRSTFVIDKKGKIAEIFSPVKVDGHDAEVIAALQKLK